jgi:lipoprotein-anchoring transpeptidase ErfK/SrfK
MSTRRRTARSLTLALPVALALATAGCVSSPPASAPPPDSTATSTPAPVHDGSPERGRPSSTPAALPEPPSTDGLPLAVHDAVIGALLPGPDEVPTHTGLLEHDLPLYARRGGDPVAVLPARDFLREPTVVSVVQQADPWTLVLTPARRVLPSAAGPEGAPAQTAAWVRSADLPPLRRTTATVTVHVAQQTLTVTTPDGTSRHEVGVGQDATPTPTDVTGYLQARYTDPAQALAPGAIQLTSLHATATDEPYLGSDGGLIGIHASPHPRGRSSHGCIRAAADVLARVDALPLGTPVVVLP